MASTVKQALKDGSGDGDGWRPELCRLELQVGRGPKTKQGSVTCTLCSRFLAVDYDPACLQDAEPSGVPYFLENGFQTVVRGCPTILCCWVTWRLTLPPKILSLRFAPSFLRDANRIVSLLLDLLDSSFFKESMETLLTPKKSIDVVSWFDVAMVGGWT